MRETVCAHILNDQSLVSVIGGKSMNLRIVLIFMFVLLVSFTGTASAASQGVSKNMETLAKVLYANENPDSAWERDKKFIFDKVDVIEVGENHGRGMPVKFRMRGICGFQRLSEQPKDFKGPGVWIGDFIEAEEKFDKIIVVFYTKDEFNKLQACDKIHFYCVSEENMEQYRAKLADMVRKHKLAMEKDAKNKVEYAQKRADEKEKKAKIEQLRIPAQSPTETLGKYLCYDRGFDDSKMPLGQAILTDVDVSYVQIYPNQKPFKSKVVFEFTNIKQIRKMDNKEVVFKLKHRIYSRPGDERALIRFADEKTRDRFFEDIVKAKGLWDEKYPELKEAENIEDNLSKLTITSSSENDNVQTSSTTTSSPNKDNVQESGTGSDLVVDNVKKFNKWLLKGQSTSQ